jgi:hypothetical protein
MDEVQRLRDGLRSARPGDWVTTALSALDEPGIRYFGKSNTAVSADDLIGSYHVRLKHCRQDVRSDIESLLSALRELAGSTPIFVKPFAGNRHFVWAFWTSERVVGCITGRSDTPSDLLDEVKAAAS